MTFQKMSALGPRVKLLSHLSKGEVLDIKLWQLKSASFSTLMPIIFFTRTTKFAENTRNYPLSCFANIATAIQLYFSNALN